MQCRTFLILIYIAEFELFVSESGMDIFSTTFQTILDGITPSILQGMRDETIVLLLELCCSYFNQSVMSFQYGISYRVHF